LVAEAFFADALLSAAVLLAAAELACFDNAFEDAGAVLSFFKAFSRAWLRVFDTGS
jgi:hypothetical protein